MKPSDLHDEAVRARKDHAVSIAWIQRYQAGDPVAGNVLVTAHLPMVMSIAGRFARVATRDWEDIIQEGCLGVLRGAESYDPAKGLPSTHLWQWVRSRMGRYVLTRVETIRRPVHLYKKKASSGEEGARSWKPLAFLFSQLLADAHTNGEPTFEESILDEHLPAEEELADHDHDLACKRIAPWLLWQLPVRQRKVLELRFGFRGRDELLLREIGERLGVTRERIRQIEVEALEACRNAFPPKPHETFDAWVARAVGAKEQLETVTAERVAFIAKAPVRVAKIIRRRRAAPERGAA